MALQARAAASVALLRPLVHVSLALMNSLHRALSGKQVAYKVREGYMHLSLTLSYHSTTVADPGASPRVNVRSSGFRVGAIAIYAIYLALTSHLPFVHTKQLGNQPFEPPHILADALAPPSGSALGSASSIERNASTASSDRCFCLESIRMRGVTPLSTCAALRRAVSGQRSSCVRTRVITPTNSSSFARRT